MIDKKLIERKLRNIEGYLKELENVSIQSLDAFKEDVVVKRFIERNIELSLEQMIDICRHFVSTLDLREPESYADCFQILSENSVISLEEVEKFKSMARFRDMLIHGYGGIDDSITFGIYRNRLTDFRDFAATIRHLPPRLLIIFSGKTSVEARLFSCHRRMT